MEIFQARPRSGEHREQEREPERDRERRKWNDTKKWKSTINFDYSIFSLFCYPEFVFLLYIFTFINAIKLTYPFDYYLHKLDL